MFFLVIIMCLHCIKIRSLSMTIVMRLEIAPKMSICGGYRGVQGERNTIDSTKKNQNTPDATKKAIIRPP